MMESIKKGQSYLIVLFDSGKEWCQGRHHSMGLCAQTPGHIVVQEKGFSCTRIVYHNGRYFAYRKKYKFFSIFYIF